MGMERFHKPRPGTSHRRPLIPKVSIGTTGLVLNKRAVEKVGVDKRAVILFYDKDERVMGMWFSSSKKDANYPEDAFSVVIHSRYGTAKIAAKSFINRYELLKIVEELNQSAFLVEYDKEYATGKDYYIARLAS